MPFILLTLENLIKTGRTKYPMRSHCGFHLCETLILMYQFDIHIFCVFISVINGIIIKISVLIF